MPYCTRKTSEGRQCRVWLRFAIDCGQHTTGGQPLVGWTGSTSDRAAIADPFAQQPAPALVTPPSRLRACCDQHHTPGPLAVTPGTTWLFDMDGTLANVDQAERDNNMRAPRSKDRNFIGFQEDSLAAPPNADVVDLARQVSDRGAYVVITTARSEPAARATAFWLRDHQVPYDTIYSRGGRDGFGRTDGRPDDMVKRELLNDMRRDGHDVVRAVDDNPVVVDVWCDENVPTLVVPASRWNTDDHQR